VQRIGVVGCTLNRPYGVAFVPGGNCHVVGILTSAYGCDNVRANTKGQSTPFGDSKVPNMTQNKVKVRI